MVVSSYVVREGGVAQCGQGGRCEGASQVLLVHSTHPVSLAHTQSDWCTCLHKITGPSHTDTHAGQCRQASETVCGVSDCVGE